MAKLRCLLESHVEQLRTHAASNVARYRESEPWLESYSGGVRWWGETDIEAPDNLELKQPDHGALFDFENTRTLYTALKHLTPTEASQSRLWVYLSHVTFWPYMRRRWPVERWLNKPKSVGDNIVARYLLPPQSRSLVRNGIARLWWCGYASYDSKREDPFELTAVLFKRLDVTQSVMERAFSSNRKVTRAFLDVLRKRELAGRPFYERGEVRALAKYLVFVGGVTIIDSLTFEDLVDLINHKVEQLTSAA